METVATPRREATQFTPFADRPNEIADMPAGSLSIAWPLWQKILFRFFAVYWVLQIGPWNWFRAIPGVSLILQPYYIALDWAVRQGNAHLFHVREKLVPMNGSGDTSYAYAQLCLFVSLAAASAIVWTVLDRKRPNYERAAFWLRQIVRYYVAMAALSYGIIKLLVLQMPNNFLPIFQR